MRFSRSTAFAIYPLATRGGRRRLQGGADARRTIDFDLDAIAAAIDDNTRIVFLGNPNNPTGTIYRRAEWQRFLAQVPERVVIVADEAYFEFVRDPEYPDSIAGSRRAADARDAAHVFEDFRPRGAARRLRGCAPGHHPPAQQCAAAVQRHLAGQVAVVAGMDDTSTCGARCEVNASGMAYLEGEFSRLGLPYVAKPCEFYPGRGRRRARGLRQAVCNTA